MIPLKINRDSAGKIVSIARYYSLQRTAVMLVVALAMVLGGLALFALPLPRAASFHQLYLHGCALALAGVGIWCCATAVKRIFNKKARDVLVADALGLRFSFYEAMGTVPWSDIRGFARVPFNRAAAGREVLVAQLTDEAKYLGKARSAALTNNYLPGGKYPLPFPTVANARLTDLPALEEALRTMISQQRIALAPGGLTSDAFREKTLATMQAAAVRAKRNRWIAFVPLAIVVVIFGFAMLYRQIYGLQALRQAHGAIEIGLLLAFGSLIFLRFRRSKSG